MEYQEMKALAARMAEANVKRQLKDMFVMPEDAAIRTAQHMKANTQDWLREEQAMFDALWALEHLGYQVAQ